MDRLRELARELYRRNPILAVTGWCFLALGVALVAAMSFDGVQILGVDRFLKPLKFAVSIQIYVWTLAWFSGYIERTRLLAWVSAGITVIVVTEIVCIAGQAFRGRLSHFNHATPFDAKVFILMGVMIMLNTVLAAAFLVLFVRRTRPLNPAYRLGIVLGLVIFILGSLEAVAMLLNGAHTVGAPDGGPGLPLVNWSTRAGDLRAAHLLGLHALQVLPVAGWLLRRVDRQVPLAWLFALGYAAVMAALFLQALAGSPVLRLS